MVRKVSLQKKIKRKVKRVKYWLRRHSWFRRLQRTRRTITRQFKAVVVAGGSQPAKLARGYSPTARRSAGSLRGGRGRTASVGVATQKPPAQNFALSSGAASISAATVPRRRENAVSMFDKLKNS